MDINSNQVEILFDLVGSIVLDDTSTERSSYGSIINVDIYALILLLVAELYQREASRSATADIWPSDHGMLPQAEPSSPMKLTSRAWGAARDSGPSPTHKTPLNLAQQYMMDHLRHQEALQTGLPLFIARHSETFLQLVLDDPHSSMSDGDFISTTEFDRLETLLEWRNTSEDGEGAMDVCEERIILEEERRQPLSFYASDLFSEGSNKASLRSAVAWIEKEFSAQEEDAADAAMAMAISPPRGTALLDILSPPGSSLLSPTDIHGVSKTTVVKGEDAFPDGRLTIMQCHDAVVYALAPVRYALITCCTDCVIVVGAVGRALRLERCERVQLVAVTKQLTINTCHDCIAYVGVTSSPLLLGDNRFVQLAPYNAGYDKLVEHMALVGMTPRPNCWSRPITLTPDHGHHNTSNTIGSKQGDNGGGGSSSSTISSSRGMSGDGDPSVKDAPKKLRVRVSFSERELSMVRLLPPEKLAPFLIPFKGGGGHMAGGPATSFFVPGRATGHDSLSAFMDMGEFGGGNFPSSPFPLPIEYSDAWEGKMAGASHVRAAVKSANLEDGKKKVLMSAIQAHFKEWLHSTGNMSQVYHLARAERDEAAVATHSLS